MSRVKKALIHDVRLGVVKCTAGLIRPTAFLFFDRKSGARRFEVEADRDGRMPVERAASLLAIHSVARQQEPSDFTVAIATDEALIDGIVSRANKLIRTCSGFKVAGLPLSRRQHEVLAAIAQNLSNKEIAARLNVSVRTVKFHVSTLLEKFKVRGRVDLMLEAGEFLPMVGARKRVAAAASSGASVISRATPLPMVPPQLGVANPMQ